MDTGEKLKLLLATCKGCVYITVNDHRNDYQTAEQHILEDEANRGPGRISMEVTPEVRAGMIERDSIVTIHFYPKHPVSFYVVWHYEIDGALDEAIAYLRKDGLLK